MFKLLRDATEKKMFPNKCQILIIKKAIALNSSNFIICHHTDVLLIQIFTKEMKK